MATTPEELESLVRKSSHEQFNTLSDKIEKGLRSEALQSGMKNFRADISAAGFPHFVIDEVVRHYQNNKWDVYKDTDKQDGNTILVFKKKKPISISSNYQDQGTSQWDR